MYKRWNVCIVLMLAFVMLLSACTSNAPDNSDSNVQENSASAETNGLEIDADNSIDNENTMTSQNVTVTSVGRRRAVGSKIWYEVSYRLEEGEDVPLGYMNTEGIILTEEPAVFLSPKLPI